MVKPISVGRFLGGAQCSVRRTREAAHGGDVRYGVQYSVKRAQGVLLVDLVCVWAP